MFEKENNNWEWYDLKYEMAEFILDRLINYQKEYNQDGYSLPTWLLENSKRKETYTKKESESLIVLWNSEIEKMKYSFEQILNSRLETEREFEYDEVKIQNGLNLFSKYFLHFWD